MIAGGANPAVLNFNMKGGTKHENRKPMRRLLTVSGSQDNGHTSGNRGEEQYLCPYEGTVGDPQKQDTEERTIREQTQS